MRGTIDFRAIMDLGDLELITLMGTVHRTMSEDSTVDDSKWHPETAKLAVLAERKDGMQSTYSAALYKDLLKVAAKKQQRELCIDNLKQVANNAELAAWNDPARLAAWGFPLVRPRAVTKPIDLGGVENFTVIQGEHPGQLIGKAKKLPKCAFYDVHMTEGDPTVEEGYALFDSFPSCSHMVFNGLTPTKRVSFRVRGRNGKGAGPWSPTFTIIVT